MRSMGKSTISIAIFNSYVKLPECKYEGVRKWRYPPSHPNSTILGGLRRFSNPSNDPEVDNV